MIFQTIYNFVIGAHLRCINSKFNSSNSNTSATRIEFKKCFQWRDKRVIAKLTNEKSEQTPNNSHRNSFGFVERILAVVVYIKTANAAAQDDISYHIFNAHYGRKTSIHSLTHSRTHSELSFSPSVDCLLIETKTTAVRRVTICFGFVFVCRFSVRFDCTFKHLLRIGLTRDS